MFLGLVAFLLYLWLFVGFEGLFTLLSGLDVYHYSLFLSLAVGALFAGIVFDSLIWYSLLTSLDVKVKFRKLFLYNWIGNFVELILPSATIGGEVIRIALSQKEIKHDTGIAAATVLGSRIISTFVYSGGLILGFLFLLFTHKLPFYLITPIILVISGTTVVVASVFLIAFKETATDKIINILMWIIKHVIKDSEKQEKLKIKIRHSLFSFSGVFKTFKNQPRRLIKPVLYAVVSWLFNLTVYLMILYALDFTAISLIDLATVYCIITTVETLTAGVPIGAVEVTLINLFVLYGVPIAVAGAATTIVRLLTFWSQIVVGYPLIEWMGTKSLLRATQTPPHKTPPNDKNTPSPVN
jgi:uncharacterized protein (TIRG00374 family)